MADEPYKSMNGSGKATTAVPAQQTTIPHAVAVTDVESGATITNVVYIASAPVVQKMSFVRTVYGILSAQLLVTFGIVLAFFLPGCFEVNCTATSIRTQIQESAWIFWVVLVAWIILYIGCVFAQFACRKAPYNYIVLSAFTLGTGVFLGVLSCYSTLVEVAIAIGLTILIAVSIIVLTHCSFMNGFVGPAPYIAVAVMAIFWSCMLLIPVAFGVLWYTYFNVLWSGLGVLLFSLFIIYDTTIIIAGSHRKIKFTGQDHCVAALSLYLDIVNLFICLLSGGRR
eukprot:CAMPEP_0195523838 /NCGR_PEP_ID=MMETSP0794_2-20130614/23294_1 /TAXON_ID=515487 /ORGANISM="Stephanopyxis turris, Strain CCMP 815" /LENGTH=282 /DNA_ID=CAMNT_0040653921 /DNA_START=97 /DNA_END=945 /DNA_ORIENTATION=-